MTENDRDRRQEPAGPASTGTGATDAVHPGDPPRAGDDSSAADQAVANQERMLETGEENPV